MKKKILSLLVTFAMLFSMLPTTALAIEFDDAAGSDDVASNSYYEFEDVLDPSGVPMLLATGQDETVTIDLNEGSYTIETAGDYVVSAYTGANTLTIKADATVELQGVNITAPEATSAISIESGNVTLNVTAGSTVKGGDDKGHGISVAKGATVTIKGGKLTAYGGNYTEGGHLQTDYGKNDPEGGAGIGGGTKDGAGVGTINIVDATVIAYGGSKAAGIGAMFWNSVEAINIGGNSNVTAYGGSSSAGIGTSRAGDGVSSNITISGGTVTAVGGDYGSGIGAGYNADSLGNGADASGLPETSITITGGTVNATGGMGGAAIGGGYKSDNVDIDLTGGTITATAGALVEGKTVENGGAPAAIGSGANGSGTFENSPAVEIGENVTSVTVTAYEGGKAAVEGMKNDDLPNIDNVSLELTKVRAGSITPVYTRADGFWGEGGGNASESLVVELYEGKTKIASASLNNVGGIIDGDVFVTWSIPFAGSTDEYWTVEWAEGYPKYDMNPTKGVMVIDGAAVAESAVQYNAPDNLNKIVALAEGYTGGVVAYTSLTDAIGNFNGRQVNVLRDVTEEIEDMNGATLTTNVEGGVTITSTYDNYVYANDLTIGKGITVKSANWFFETDGVNTIEGVLEVGSGESGVFYHGYDAKTTVQNGGQLIVNGSTILRYNESADAGLYIYGDGDDETVEYKNSYYIGAYSGTFYAEDANVECGYFLLKNSYDSSTYADIDMTLDNSTLTVVGTSDTQDSFVIDDQASLTLKNGSAIADVRDFSILAGANLTLSIDETSSISATNVSIAEGVPLSFEKNEDGTVTFTKKVTITGTGTAEDPYQIGTKEEMFLFAEKVNDGTYKNVYVILTADIDLEQDDWTSIGTSSNPFTGTFDGKGFTISNLWSYERGLFGYTSTGNYVDSGTNGRATIKNFTLDGAEVYNQTVSAVGGVVGQANMNTEITDVTLTGEIQIHGHGYVGGIVGQGYVHVDDCHVNGKLNEENEINASYWAVGGIVGHAGSEGGSSITNCSVKNVTITSAYYGAGAIAGVGTDGPISDVSAENVAVVADSTPNANGLLVGCNYAAITGTSTAKDVTLTVNGTAVEAAQDMVAEVNGTYYATLQSALDAAVLAGDTVTVTLLDNIDLTGTAWTPVYFNSYRADGTNTLIIDGNNKTITGLSDMLFSGIWTGTKFEVKNLTIDKANIVNDAEDATNIGVGAIVGNVSAIEEVVLTNVKLTNSHVEGGHWTGGFFGYIAGYSGNDGPVFTTVTINGCSVTDSTIIGKGSVGGVVGHATGDAWTSFGIETSTVTGNTITSTGSSNNKAGIVAGTIGAAGTAQTTNGTTLTGGVSVNVTESGNTAKSNETFITTVYGRQGSSTGVLNVTGGTYDSYPIEENVSYAAPAEGHVIVKNEDETYSVKAVYVAEVNGEKFTTLAAAIDAIATDGSDTTIKLLCDAEMNADIAADYGTGKIIFTAEEPVTVKQTALETDFDFVKANAANIVIEENVTIEVYDNSSGMYLYYGPSLTLNGTVTGGQNWGVLYLFQGKQHTVSNTGKISTGRVQLGYTDITVQGEIDTNYLLVEGSAFTADGATVDAGVIYDNNNGGQRWGASAFDIKNGSEVTAGTLTLSYADSKLTIDMGSTLTATTITGAGQIIIDAENYESGDVCPITGDASAFTGTLEVINNDAVTAVIDESGNIVLVPVPVTGVVLDKASASVKVGNTVTLTATVAPDNANNKNVTWTSSNEGVATVEDGVVTGVAAGTATITVTTEDGGFTASCTVTVSKASTGGSGGGSSGGGSTSYTIAVEDAKNGDITVSPSRASKGTTVTITVDPDNGYELDKLTVLDKNGKEVELTKKSDNKYTFTMPSGKVTIEGTFAEIEEFENPFVDVAEGKYYYDAVLWAAENGITGGTTATTFEPATTCTRAQTVTFLWRAAGSPEPESTVMPFTDVVEGSYYYDAVLWAVENGITAGTSATTFEPNATVTRAQNVTFLWRWAESPAAEQANPFTDVAEGKYYHDAVIWAAEQGITSGTTATTFSPDDPCLRSQIVTFLYRYLAD